MGKIYFGLRRDLPEEVKLPLDISLVTTREFVQFCGSLTQLELDKLTTEIAAAKVLYCDMNTTVCADELPKEFKIMSAFRRELTGRSNGSISSLPMAPKDIEARYADIDSADPDQLDDREFAVCVMHEFNAYRTRGQHLDKSTLAKITRLRRPAKGNIPRNFQDFVDAIAVQSKSPKYFVTQTLFRNQDNFNRALHGSQSNKVLAAGLKEKSSSSKNPIYKKYLAAMQEKYPDLIKSGIELLPESDFVKMMNRSHPLGFKSATFTPTQVRDMIGSAAADLNANKWGIRNKFTTVLSYIEDRIKNPERYS